ncbi:hypothetical protein GGI21_005310, partial [Coemansia aciculifera]
MVLAAGNSHASAGVNRSEPLQLQGALGDMTVGADDIETQGLLDDLDGLYDFNDESVPSRIANSRNGTSDYMAPARSILAVVHSSTARPPLMPQRAAVVDKPKRGGDASGLLLDDGLGDMSDSEAMKIIDVLGGFGTNKAASRSLSSNSSAAVVSTGSGDEDRDAARAPPPPPNADVLSDMDDAEARGIIQKFGGFA